MTMKYPIGSMYGIYANMYPINIPPLCYHIYHIHGSVMGYVKCGYSEI